MSNEEFLITALAISLAVAASGVLYFILELVAERQAHQRTTKQRDELLVQADRALAGWKGCIAEQASTLLATVKAKSSEDSAGG